MSENKRRQVHQMGENEVVICDLYDQLQDKFNLITQNNQGAGDIANIMHKITQQTLREAMAPLNAQLTSQKKEIDALKAEQTLTESRVACLESQVHYLQDQISDIKEYSCSNNLILEGITELEDEDVTTVVRDFMRNDLKLNDEADEILLDICHRMGSVRKPTVGANPENTDVSTKPRQIIVRFVKRVDKQTVLSKGPELKDTSIHMWEHVPPELREERRTLFEERKERIARGQKKVNVRGSRLLVGNQVVRDLKKENGRRIPESELINKRAAEMMPKIKNVKQTNVQGSVFKSYFLPIDNKADIKPALIAIRSAGQTSGATHNIWAASIGGYKQRWDDREHGAAYRLLQTLNASKKQGIVVVARYYGGSHLGEDRFRAICHVGKEAIDSYE